MTTKLAAAATALAISAMYATEASAELWTRPAVPEFDGPGGVAAIALLASVVAIVFHRARS